MRNLIFVLSIALLISGCSGTEENQHTTATTQDAAGQTEDLRKFPEYPILQANINLQKAQLTIEEDNEHTRTILLYDEQGAKTHKSIYIKETGRLKIITFDAGLLFNEII